MSANPFPPGTTRWHDFERRNLRSRKVGQRGEMTAEEAGREAAAAGLPRNINPFVPDTLSWDAWEQGYASAGRRAG